MQIRTNVGYIIIATKPSGSNEEIVLGFNPDSNMYVTWHCFNGNDYYHGHYEEDFLKAVEDFKRR